jgi:hypothetical protein
MTANIKGKPTLGDLLAPDSEFLREPRETTPKAGAGTLQSAEDILVALADAYDVDAQEVLADFKSDHALSKLVRRILNVDESQIDHFWIAIEVLEQVRAEGHRGGRAYDEAARRIGQLRDPLGQKRMSISADSLQTYEKRARKLMKGFGIIRLFHSSRVPPLRPER